jgi:amino acid transporter
LGTPGLGRQRRDESNLRETIVIDADQAAVERHSKDLKRELRTRDLVLMQVVLVFSFLNLGPAAKQGSTHVVFWLLSIAVFYAPLAAVTIFLSRSMPLEGGVYQWAKFGLNPLAGFLAAWNYGTFMLLQVAPIGLITAGGAAYALGPSAAWMAENRWVITSFNAAIMALMLLVNIRGFHIEKWFSNAASLTILAVGVALVGLLIVHPGRATPAHPPFSLAAPALSFMSLNLFSKIGFNSLSGLEYVAFFSGESQNPARSIGRSVWLAAPVIALLYILTTGSVLMYVQPADVDLTATVPQVLSAASGSSPAFGWVIIAVIVILMGSAIIQLMVLLAAVSRLPMVAGWDGLLPAWFTELHPRFKTPARSIMFVVAACLGLAVISLLGVGRQEAFQVVYAASFTSLGIYYMILFAIPIIGMQGFERRPGAWLRIGAALGLMVSLVAFIFQLVPIVDVDQPVVFGLKVGLGIGVINLAGLLLYLRARRKTRVSSQAGGV